MVAQATDFGDGFVAFALVLLPVVFFLGAVTIVRLTQVAWEDGVWVQGLNRIRHAYLELAPELEPYFVTSHYDDDAAHRGARPRRHQALLRGGREPRLPFGGRRVPPRSRPNG
jgi:hypothetical protein